MNYFDVVFNEQMELLIKDFRISLFSIYTSIMESYRSTESSKGIYSIYIGTITYWTINIITNDFIILNCINSFCRYINIGVTLELPLRLESSVLIPFPSCIM